MLIEAEQQQNVSWIWRGSLRDLIRKIIGAVELNGEAAVFKMPLIHEIVGLNSRVYVSFAFPRPKKEARCLIRQTASIFLTWLDITLR